MNGNSVFKLISTYIKYKARCKRIVVVSQEIGPYLYAVFWRANTENMKNIQNKSFVEMFTNFVFVIVK